MHLMFKDIILYNHTAVRKNESLIILYRPSNKIVNFMFPGGRGSDSRARPNWSYSVKFKNRLFLNSAEKTDSI